MQKIHHAGTLDHVVGMFKSYICDHIVIFFLLFYSHASITTTSICGFISLPIMFFHFCLVLSMAVAVDILVGTIGLSNSCTKPCMPGISVVKYSCILKFLENHSYTW